MAPRSLIEIEEDLAVARVILESLDYETFEGIEGERQEAREKITQLEDEAKDARQNPGAVTGGHSQHGESSNTGSGSQHTVQQHAFQQQAVQQHAAVPSRDGQHTPGPSTPVRRRDSQVMEAPQSGNNIWGPSGSGSLANHSRKRNYDAAQLPRGGEQQIKSRRTSPSPAFNSPFSTQGSEIIDLTGIDDGDDDYVARVKKEEDRRALEKRDRDYAMSISSDDSGASVPVLTSSRLTQRNALQHLMATQRANSYAPGQQRADEPVSTYQQQARPGADPSAVATHQRPFAQGYSDTAPRIPGAYDPAWDNYRDPTPSTPTPATYSPAGLGPSHSGSRGGQTPTVQAHGPVGPMRVVPEGHTGGSGGPYNQFMYPWMAPAIPNQLPRSPSERSSRPGPGAGPNGSPMHPTARSVQELMAMGRNPGPAGLTRADMPPWGSFRQQMLSGTLNGQLSSIINKTAGYDFANRTDAYGRPLPSHLANYLDETDPYQNPEVTAKELDELLQNIEPEIQVPKGLQGITPEALTTPLYKHQEVALTWMKKMEDGTNKGGILADDMGLGKTISTLALIHERKSTTRPKTNLIVGPVALIRQWEEEIYRKTNSSHRLSVFVYHGKKTTPDEIMRYDVVLTTYGMVAAELKRREKWEEARIDREKDYNDRELAVKCPLLHPTKTKFHRVILDEAQCIKNGSTQTAKACHQLRAEFRWCLTGTPMMNGVSELYSLLKFLQIKPYNIWPEFRQAFGVLFGKKGDAKSTAMHRLRVLLKAILLRRKKNSLIDGKPIVELPAKTEEIKYAALSEDERDFYSQLESKSQVIFNKYLREGSVGKNYANVLVLLLRLRQACCHPHLNLDVDDVAPAVDDNMLERVKQLEPATVNRIREVEAFECPVCYDVMQSPAFFFPCGHDCCRPCLTKLIDNAAQNNIQAGNESNKVTCITCRAEFDPKACFSIEAFQEVHMPEEHAKRVAEAEQENDDESSDGSDDDGESDAGSDVDSAAEDSDVDAQGNLKDFINDDSDSDLLNDPLPLKLTKGKFSKKSGEAKVKSEVKTEVKSEVKDEPKVEAEANQEVKGEESGTNSLDSVPQHTPPSEADAEALVDEKPKLKKKKKSRSKRNGKEKAGKGKGKAKVSDIKPSMLKSLRKESFKNRASYKKYMAYLRQTWLPSAKVEDCIRLLQEFHETGEKTIIFSQWTLLLDLIEVAMGHTFDKKPARYDGSMSATERGIAAQDFRDKRDCKVLLVSLRAGNAGLNLTAASRVIIMDPFWNPYIEMQAVDRAYRIGQKNEVKVYRILTQETVEDRIVALQERKKEMVEAALDENAGKQIGRLSVAELKFLFTGNR